MAVAQSASDNNTVMYFQFCGWCYVHIMAQIQIQAPHTNTRNHFMALLPGLPGWASARRSLLDFMVQGKISEADTPIIRLGATASGVISDPPPSSSHFYVGCHSCCNPPWLGTGTKYAGLYTQAISELFTVTSQMVLGVKFAIPELLCCLDCDSLPFVMCLLYTHTYFQYTSTFHVSRRRHEIYIGHTSLSVCVCPLLHAHTTAWTQNQM